MYNIKIVIFGVVHKSLILPRINFITALAWKSCAKQISLQQNAYKRVQVQVNNLVALTLCLVVYCIDVIYVPTILVEFQSDVYEGCSVHVYSISI